MAVRFCFGLSLLLLLLSTRALAESPEHALAAGERTNRLWIRAIGYTGTVNDERKLVIAPRFGGAFLLGDRVDLDVEMPLVLANNEEMGQSETRTLVGNPFVGASLVTDVRGNRFSLGFGVAFPVASDKEDDDYDGPIYRYARAARAGREAWLYTPDRLGLVLSGAFENKIEHGPALGFDYAVAIMPRVYGEGSNVTSTAQLGLSIAGVINENVRMGGRFDAVQLSSEETERLQFAAVPFLHVSTADGVMFALELTVNLDDPYGLSFEDGGIFGLSILAGSRF